VGLIAVHAACLHEASQTCRDGSVCPVGLQCVDTASTTPLGQICAAGPCGNGRLDPGEACDDGNNRSGDGCPADCTRPCGDGVQDPTEVCDDGNHDDGDGCSADCQVLEGGFRVAPSSITLDATEGDPLPAAIEVTAQLAYVGDSVVVGYAPGIAQPTWLSIASGPTTGTTAAFELHIGDTSTPGERATSVRLTVRHARSTGLETFDLPVRYRVAATDLAVHASPDSAAFLAAEGDVVLPSRSVLVTFNGDDVAPIAVPSWLTVIGPPAPASPAAFTVAVKDASFAPGTVLSGDVVFATTRRLLQRTARVRVDYRVVAPEELAIAAAPSALTFTAVTGAATPPPQAIELAFTGASVELVSAPPWLTVSAPQLPGRPARFTASVNTTGFAGGTQLGELVFGTTRDGVQQTTTVPVEYDVRFAPEIQFVGPYLGIAGRAGTLYVRGHGLDTGHPVTLRIGDHTYDPVTPDNDTVVTLSYPALPVGRYPVTLIDPPGIVSTSPELVIVAPPRFTYQAIAAAGVRSRIVYDAERQALYAVNWLDQQIEHFAYDGGSWAVRAPHIVPELTDIAMTPDGRALVVLDRRTINDMSLTDGQFAAVARAGFPPSPTDCDFFSEATPANDGQIFVHTRIDGTSESVWPCLAYFYNVLDHSLHGIEIFHGGRGGASGDGSRIYAGSEGGGEYRVYDALTATLSSSTTTGGGFGSVSASRDGSRVLVGGSVFDHALSYLGDLPYVWRDAVLMSQDARRAYGYFDDDDGGHLEVYDLTAAIEPGGVYPLLTTITTADRANRFAHHTVRMIGSPDDSTVFIIGETQLLVVPVP